MALTNIQEVIERSIYEAIRKVIVANNYLPDTAAYPNNTVGNNNYDTAVDAVVAAKGFATELFGHGSNEAKGLKRTPRIVIIPGRIYPGELGSLPGSSIERSKTNPLAFVTLEGASLDSVDLQMEIHLVSSNAKQDRVLHAILAKALGTKAFIPTYDSQELFFIKQINFYDLPDNEEGISEKIYTYEVKDLYLNEGVTTNISLIKEITVETELSTLETIFQQDGIILGPYVSDGNLHIDLSGIKFN